MKPGDAGRRSRSQTPEVGPGLSLEVVGSGLDGTVGGSLRPPIPRSPSARNRNELSRPPRASEVYAAAIADLQESDTKSLTKLQQLRAQAASPVSSPIRKRSSSGYAPGALPALPPSPNAVSTLSILSRTLSRNGADTTSILSGRHTQDEIVTRHAASNASGGGASPHGAAVLAPDPTFIAHANSSRRSASAPDSQAQQASAHSHADPWKAEPLRTGMGMFSRVGHSTTPLPFADRPSTSQGDPLPADGDPQRQQKERTRQQQRQVEGQAPVGMYLPNHIASSAQHGPGPPTQPPVQHQRQQQQHPQQHRVPVPPSQAGTPVQVPVHSLPPSHSSNSLKPRPPGEAGPVGLTAIRTRRNSQTIVGSPEQRFDSPHAVEASGPSGSSLPAPTTSFSRTSEPTSAHRHTLSSGGGAVRLMHTLSAGGGPGDGEGLTPTSSGSLATPAYRHESPVHTPTSRPGSGRSRAVQLLIDAVRSKDDMRFAETLDYLKMPQTGTVAGLNDRHNVAGRTPLHEAVMLSSVPMVRTLLALGADPNIGHMSQGPPLLHAAAWGESTMIQLLLEAGADIGARDIAGYTSLHYACSGGHVDTVRVLLARGADRSARTNDGETPFTLAEGHPAITRLLEDAAPSPARGAAAAAAAKAAEGAPASPPLPHTRLHPTRPSSGQAAAAAAAAPDQQLAVEVSLRPLPPAARAGASTLETAGSTGSTGLGVQRSGRSFRRNSLRAAVDDGAATSGSESSPSIYSSPPLTSRGRPQVPSGLAALSPMSPMSDGDSTAATTPPPQLELPRGVRRQLSRGAVLQDIIHAFEEEDQEVVRRFTLTGEGFPPMPPQYPPPPRPPTMQQQQQQAAATAATAAQPPSVPVSVPPAQQQQTIRFGSPPVTSAMQPAPPALPLHMQLLQRNMVAANGASGVPGSAAASPRLHGLAAAVPITPRFRFGCDINAQPPMQQQQQATAPAQPPSTLPLPQQQQQQQQQQEEEVDLPQQLDDRPSGGSTVNLDASSGSAIGATIPALAAQALAGSVAASIASSSGTPLTSGGGAGHVSGDRISLAGGFRSQDDLGPPLVHDSSPVHSPPQSPRRDAPLNRASHDVATASHHHHANGTVTRPNPQAGNERRGSTGTTGIMRSTPRAGTPPPPKMWQVEGFTDPQRISQAAQALAARAGGSHEALQLRAAALFNRSIELYTGNIQWTRGELLGEGSFGRVFAGLNQTTGELMAVKVLELMTRQGSVTEGALQQLRELQLELELYKKLAHPHVVGYIDHHFDPAASTLYIFLEYVPGGSIASMLERFGKFSEELIRNYTRQLLLGLEYLHGCKIMHRDLKGGNALVTRDGVVKLADFGASKAYQNETITDGMKSIKGSVFWMAPEVIKGTGYNNRADIWSLGCTVIEMLTGKHPWPNLDNHWSAMFNIAKEEAGPPRPKGLSKLAADFLDQCLRYDPKDRPSAAELLRHPFVAGTDVAKRTEDALAREMNSTASGRQAAMSPQRQH